MSRKGLDDDDFLVNAETVEHTEQVLPTARHLPLHGQTEIFLHSFGDPSSHCVMSAKGRFCFFLNVNITINLLLIQTQDLSDLLKSR